MDSRDFSKDESSFDFILLCKSLNEHVRSEQNKLSIFDADLLSLFQFCMETRIVDPLQFQRYAIDISKDDINRNLLQDTISELVDRGYTLGAATITACIGCLYNLKQITTIINSLLVTRNQTEVETLAMFLVALPAVLDEENLGRTAQHLVEIRLKKWKKISNI